MTKRSGRDDLFGFDAVLADLRGGEPPIRLQDVAKHPMVPRRNGRYVHVSVPYRWVMRGLRGYRLESCRCGGTLCTSASAIARFFHRLSGGESTARAEPLVARQRGLARVEQHLKEAGL